MSSVPGEISPDLSSPSSEAPSPGRRRSDGERSRRAILKVAAELASVRGLDGLSLGVLADQLGISKSGLFAHFGSKEELALATIEAAAQVFHHDVIAPATTAPAGVARLSAFCEGYLSHVERRVFPGGCFFASVAAEFDARSGPVREKIAEHQQQWFVRLTSEVRDAQDRGELDQAADAIQLAFEINAALGAANSWFVMTGSAEGPARARHAIEGVIRRAAAR